ncbi:AzlC family ABC transporter permease [Winslowiella iniecta]|uniref:Branched-chain amino acid ABC transporter permease n=1 Tax=Winslowiella iniecta TaxID=1560201 RepID=A0A0L7T0P7_9GAMM|nr:AzlC family ABC transporter permease [Winslowiella iniecta]KOC88806.1 branched-chain amino acid ABC transporter permease [Winslowiella iniecta]KOC90788.1 branched-chain amino acid ABC transporter permease [Winslowiella iniecta]
MPFRGFSPLSADVIKAIALVCLADGLVGISYGSLATGYGFPLWVPLTLSLLVLAGASEFLFIGIVAGGGSPLAAAAAGLLVNARHLPFGIAVKELVGRHYRSYLGCHIMNDESVVFGVSQPSVPERKAAYWLCGIGIAVCWPLGVLLGTSLGKLIPDTHAIGLDAVFPAILLALIFSALKKFSTLISAVSGGVISLITVPFVPVGLPVLFSLLGLLIRRRAK